MKITQLLIIGASLLAITVPPLAGAQMRGPYVRLAELEIDPAQFESFKAAIKEGIDAAVRLEPGVLVLYAVSEKDNPNLVRVFEVYTDETAYKTHLETAHFKKFRDTTNQMVKSRKFLDADPIILGAKAK
jgi:quinol monooxygenase YgiN